MLHRRKRGNVGVLDSPCFLPQCSLCLRGDVSEKLNQAGTEDAEMTKRKLRFDPTQTSADDKLQANKVSCHRSISTSIVAALPTKYRRLHAQSHCRHPDKQRH